MDIIIVSPIPSHPQNQGNSARITAMARGLQALGARVYFIYVALEGVNPKHCAEMRKAWDEFDVVPLSTDRRRSRAETFAIDDWYEPQLDILLEEKFQTREFDMIIVNYVWFSRAFERVPSRCLKVLDTHDVFGNRHLRLIEDGIRPAWFYTTALEESIGLARADLIIAIQEDEAKVFSARTSAPVRVIGHILPANFLPGRRQSGPIRVSYIASGNPSNIYSLQQLCESLRSHDGLQNKFEFMLAGTICDNYAGEILPFNRAGRVEYIEHAYADCDVALNPNMSGTGLKIKTVEALSFGRPLFATIGAMVGIETTTPEHMCASLDELVHRLQNLSSLEHLSEQSRDTFLRYQQRQLHALSELYELALTRRCSQGGQEPVRA